MRFNSDLFTFSHQQSVPEYLIGESAATSEDIGKLATYVAFIYRTADFDDSSAQNAFSLYYDAHAQLPNLEDAARTDVRLAIQRGNVQYPSFDIYARQKFDQDVGEFYLINETHYAFSSKSQRGPRYEWKVTQDVYQATDNDEVFLHGQSGRYFVDSPESLHGYLSADNDERQVRALINLTGQERLSRNRCDRLLDILKRMDVQVLRPEQFEGTAKAR